MIVTLAGHVDHGKTSLVRALTDIDTDRLAEEKRRGLTIDLGFAYTDLDGRRVGFVDVPGHHRFVHNMVAGIAGRQYALLVVAADDGVMPQSREHLQILRLLGLRHGVVVVNKVDRVSADRLVEVRRQIRTLVDGSFLATAQILDVSCETGKGIDDLRGHLEQAARSDTHASRDALFRLAIDRAFTVRGSGVVVTGTVVDGTTTIDARLVTSTGTPVRVRGIHVQNEPSTTASAGDRAAINIAGAALGELNRGHWLLDPAAREPVDGFATRLTVLDDFPRPVKHNAPVHAYHATSHTQARILLIEGAPIEAGATATCDVVCEEPLHVKIGDRFVLRDHDLECTLGGGRVTEIGVPRSRRRNESRCQRLAGVQLDDVADSLSRLANQSPLSVEDFARHWNLAAETVEQLAANARLQRIDNHVLHPELVDAASSFVHDKLAEHHREHPDSSGLNADEICAGNSAERHAQRLVLAAQVDAGALRVDNGRYAETTHRAAIPGQVQRLFESVETWLDSTQPPSLGDIAKRLRRPFPAFEREMRALPAFHLAVRVSDTRYYLPARLAELADAAVRLDTQGPFTVRDFRDATGVGRNIVIEVLEHFDAAGFTKRVGDTRQVIGDPATIRQAS